MPQLVGKEVGKVGYGLMGLTWAVYGDLPPNSQSFAAMRTALANGSNFWNGGTLYGTAERNSLHLLKEYFTEYPEDAEKIVLSIKGGNVPGTPTPDGTEEGVRRSIDECLAVLGDKKKLDLFECARVTKNVPIETSVGAIAEYVKQGKVGGVSLSEVSANSIRRAAKITEIKAVEVEFSLFSTDILTNGVAATCAELGIPIIAYSPLARGFLTGQIKSISDLPENDSRRHYPRFFPENFDENLKLVEEVKKLAEKKGCTPGQIALSWILHLSGRDGNPTIIPIPGSTNEKRVIENSHFVELHDADLKGITDILENFRVKGERYPPQVSAHWDE